MHETPIVSHVVDQGIEIDFEDGLVYLQRQEVAHLVEAEVTCSLDEDELVAQLVKNLATNQSIGGAEHVVLHREVVSTGIQFLTHTNELLDAS